MQPDTKPRHRKAVFLEQPHHAECAFDPADLHQIGPENDALHKARAFNASAAGDILNHFHAKRLESADTLKDLAANEVEAAGAEEVPGTRVGDLPQAHGPHGKC